MAVTQSTRANTLRLLRTVYLNDMRRQMNQNSVTMQEFARRTKKIKQGEKISVPMHFEAGEGPVVNLSASLPPAAVEQYERAEFNYYWTKARAELTEDLIDDAGSPDAAEGDPLELQMKALQMSCRHMANVLMFGDGSGLLADIESSASTTTLVATSIRNLRNNLRVDVLKKSDGSPADGVAGLQIKINRSTRTVTLQGGSMGAFATINGSPTLYGIYLHDSYNTCQYGLKAAVSDTNPPTGVTKYGGIDRTDDAFDNYRGNVLANGGVARPITPDLIQDAVDEVTINSEYSPDLILCGHSVFKQLVSQCRNDKRFAGGDMLFNDWAEAYKWANIPVVKDKHCDPSEMYILNRGSFILAQNDDGHWFGDKSGGIIRASPNGLAYQVAWSWRYNLICLVPRANCVIRDLEWQNVA